MQRQIPFKRSDLTERIVEAHDWRRWKVTSHSQMACTLGR
jgi:hypothetical protein